LAEVSNKTVVSGLEAESAREVARDSPNFPTGTPHAENVRPKEPQMPDEIQQGKDQVLQAAKEHDVKFVSLWFTDVLGFLKGFTITVE